MAKRTVEYASDLANICQGKWDEMRRLLGLFGHRKLDCDSCRAVKISRVGIIGNLQISEARLDVR